ncbi:MULTISPECIES: YidB family protein [unclassified Streptomyces]|uniref:YidB family protein n=1 Tax=unclassified Streptomyces TaxID=2593676 RepID=UPI00278C1141|nr:MULTISPECIES: YidB family protein [unclassified Streptomyces]
MASNNGGLDLGSLLGGLLGDKGGSGSAGSVLTSLLAAFTKGQSGSAGGNPLGGLLEQITKSGLVGQEQVDSWVGKGENKSLTPDQVKEGLPEVTLQKVAAESGVTPDEAAKEIAGALPTAVDKLTPDGEVPGLSLDELVQRQKM